jgi:hypothetical protein
MGFQDLVDITIDSIRDYSENNFSASWMENIQNIIYVALVQNDRNILNYFKPYQTTAMRELLGMGYWIYWDEDINVPVVRPLSYIFKDKVAIKHGAD